MEVASSQVKDLKEKGFTQISVELPEKVREWVTNQDWAPLDLFFGELTSNRPEGKIFKALQSLGNFTSIEHMLALRSAPEDEEGIWHDDGSRVLAFSLSLNLDPGSIGGGGLYLKKKGAEDKGLSPIGPLPWGEMAVFLTGVHGYEHRVGKVSQGKRLIVAGWCS
jgi:hypothetical protein